MSADRDVKNSLYVNQSAQTGDFPFPGFTLRIIPVPFGHKNIPREKNLLTGDLTVKVFSFMT